MKFKYALLVAVGLTCFTNHAFAEQELSQEELALAKQKANQGDVKIQETLGKLYEDGGYGVEQDFFEAKEWYEKAMQQGSTISMINLSNMYKAGNGVPQDYVKAKELLEKAAEKGAVEAQYSLGVMYDKGEGIPKNYTKAMEWYKKAAAQGDGYAYNNIGVMYRFGDGVTQDMTKAKEYFKQACLHKSKKGCDNYKRMNN